jgi:hypothetical protein
MFWAIFQEQSKSIHPVVCGSLLVYSGWLGVMYDSQGVRVFSQGVLPASSGLKETLSTSVTFEPP